MSESTAKSGEQLVSAKILVELRPDESAHKRFETFDTERVRRGKRWITKDVPVYSWAQYGKVHLFCPAILKWRKQEFGIWIRLEMPVDPVPTEGYRSEALTAHLAAASNLIFDSLGNQTWSNLYDDIPVWVPSVRPISSSPSSPEIFSREIAVNEAGVKELDKWAERLARGEKRFNEAREYILSHISEHSAGYDYIASELRSAASFLDSRGRCDADPHLAYRDTLPGHISSSIQDLTARKSPSSHGYKVAYH